MDLLYRYPHLIDWITLKTGLPDSTLHIHAGLLILVLVRLLTGWSLRSFLPFAGVVVAEGVNETIDRLIFGSWRWPDTRADLFYTLAWPLVLSVVALIRPVRRRSIVQAAGTLTRGDSLDTTRRSESVPPPASPSADIPSAR